MFSTEPPEPVRCEYCGAFRYFTGFPLGDRVLWSIYPDPCICEGAMAAASERERLRKEAEAAAKQAEREKRMAEKVQRITKHSGMNTRFLRRTFATFTQTPENAKAYAMAKRYADGFANLLPRNNPDPGRNGLIISGKAGVGKTHLAAAIANQLMAEGVSVICMTMIDLLSRIRATFGTGTMSESEVLSTYKKVPLLIIDDMGKEPPTEWAVSTIYNIINGRYEAMMPTIVTTNYGESELIRRMTVSGSDPITAEATVDRLREMCYGITMAGKSWRGK